MKTVKEYKGVILFFAIMFVFNTVWLISSPSADGDKQVQNEKVIVANV